MELARSLLCRRVEAELRGDHHFAAHRRECFADQTLVGDTIATIVSSSSWQRISGTFNAPTCTLQGLWLLINGAAGLEIYIDEVRIAPAAP